MSNRDSWTPLFIDLHSYIAEKEPRSEKNMLTHLSEAADISIAQMSKYANGKKKPELSTVIRIIAAVHPPVSVAHVMIHAAGYDISDSRITDNRVYDEILRSDNIHRVSKLIYEVTKSKKPHPSRREESPSMTFLHDIPDKLEGAHNSHSKE